MHYPDQPLEAERVSSYQTQAVASSGYATQGAYVSGVSGGQTYTTTTVQPAAEKVYAANTVYTTGPQYTTSYESSAVPVSGGATYVHSGEPVTRTGEWTETSYQANPSYNSTTTTYTGNDPNYIVHK